jgi:hypothetical protein
MVVSIIVMMRPLLIYYCRSRRPSYAEADIRVKIREYTAFFFVLSFKAAKAISFAKAVETISVAKTGAVKTVKLPSARIISQTLTFRQIHHL